jgi:hypothetical protein
MIERYTNRRTIDRATIDRATTARATTPGRSPTAGRAVAHSRGNTPGRSNRLALVLAVAVGAALVLLYAGTAHSETIATGDAAAGTVTVRPSDLPRPSGGMTMNAVEAKFGAPQQRQAAVGEPPISRWDYQGFTVYFERDRVIHTVVEPGY